MQEQPGAAAKFGDYTLCNVMLVTEPLEQNTQYNQYGLQVAQNSAITPFSSSYWTIKAEDELTVTMALLISLFHHYYKSPTIGWC